MNPLIQFITPPTLPDTRVYGFSQIAKVNGGQIAMISGQVGWDTEYKVLSDDLGLQTDQVFNNIRACLKELGATPRDILKLSIYITNYSQTEYSEKVSPRLIAFVDQEAPPLMTLLGVAQLARPDFRIEVEAMIVLPNA